MPPVAWMGLSSGRRVAVEIWRVAPASFSATVLPGGGDRVPVQQAGVQKGLHDHRHAADLVEVLITYLPNGLTSARCGTCGRSG